MYLMSDQKRSAKIMTPHEIKLVNEVLYTFSSSDNKSHYPKEINLSDVKQPNSIVGIWVQGKPRSIIGCYHGMSMITDNSYRLVDGDLFLIIGSVLVRYDLMRDEVVWSAEADSATCFGLYSISEHKMIIVHGELDITAFTYSGEIRWQRSGADIFSGTFELLEDRVRVEDFNEDVYVVSLH